MASERLDLHQSRSIAAASYDHERRTLRITFKPGEGSTVGRSYIYFEVPPDVAKELVAAESHGQFVNWRIKPYYEFQEMI